MNTVYFKSTLWSWKEFVVVLSLMLIVVPICIEYVLQEVLVDFFQNNLYSGTFTGLIMSIVFMTGLYLIALRPSHLSWREVGLTSFSHHYWKAIIGWTTCLIIGSIILVVGMEMIGITHENSKTESIQSHVTPFHFLIAFVSASIISPVYEEILYRGFLYRWIRMRYGVMTGMITSSLIFMLVHIPTYNTLPVNFLSGLVFTWTY